jgi:tetratricopeptide (TPR) repeat protein
MKRQLLYIILFCFAGHMGLAQSALEQAKEAYALGDYAKALNASDLQVQQHPTPEAYMVRANCLQKLGDYSMALGDYDQAKSTGYAESDLLLNRGICKISMQLFEAARMDLISYVQLNEGDAKGYYWLATLEYMCMENKACERYINEAISIDTMYAEAYYLRAANFADQKKNNMALEDFQLAYALQPELKRAKLNMAIIMLDMGQFRSAMELLDELKLEKTDFVAEILYFRGEAFYYKHDMEGACGDWVEAAQLGDTDAEAMYKKLCIDKKDKPRFKRRNYFQF